MPFSDVLLNTALPFEIAMKGLQPEWPGLEAEARGLTASVWKMMKNCWKREPSLRSTLQADLLEASLVSLTGLPVVLRDFDAFSETYSRRQSTGTSRVIRKSSKAPEKAGWFSKVWHIKPWVYHVSTCGRTFPFKIGASGTDVVSARIINMYGQDGHHKVHHYNLFAFVEVHRHFQIAESLQWPPRHNYNNIADFFGRCDVPEQAATALVFNVSPTAEPLLEYLRRRPLLKSLDSKEDAFDEV